MSRAVRLPGGDLEWGRLLADVPAADSTALGRLARRARELAERLGPPPGSVPVRLALTAGATADFLREPLRLALAARGVWPELHVAPWGQTLGELFAPDSGTARFRPSIVVVAFPDSRVGPWPTAATGASEAARLAEDACERYLDACRAIHDACGAEVVLDNFVPPAVESHGHLAARHPAAARNFVRRMNVALGDLAPERVHVHDVAALVDAVGIERWIDPRFWYLARQPVSFDCLPRYASSLASVVAAVYGRSKKLVVTDLDGTLWGGVVGEVGVDGIDVAEGSAQGDAHRALQRYLLELKRRGVLLAVASKNDPELAREPFRRHPEMLLHLDDFVAFEAGWEPKSESVRRIAGDLALGLDSVVFLDDNPAERAQVRSALPAVEVPELGGDPSDFVGALDRGGWFETVGIGGEDAGRTESYRVRRRAAELAGEAGDYESFLRELGMTAVLRPFLPASMPRVAQLVGKTNQFNLTTKRLTRAELDALIDDPAWYTLTVRLADRFGDHGLIAVLAGRLEGSVLDVELWLMSCRVIGRRVEHLVLNTVVEAAARLGASEIRGRYVPTDRNALVADLYSELGFRPAGESDGATRWKLAVDAHRPLETPIAIDRESR